jgi:hypothetical protein
MIPAGLHLVTWGAGHGMSQCMWVKIVPGNIIVSRHSHFLDQFCESIALIFDRARGILSGENMGRIAGGCRRDGER